MSYVDQDAAPTPRIRKRIPASQVGAAPPTAEVVTDPGGGLKAPPPPPPPGADEPAPPKKRGPNATSFKPGVSGNLNGRPKGAKGMKAMSKKALAQKTTVRTKTGSKKVMVIEALIQKELERAVQGDRYARKMMFDMAREVFAEIASPAADGAAPSMDFGPAGQAVLDWYAEEIRAGHVPGEGVSDGGDERSDDADHDRDGDAQ